MSFNLTPAQVADFHRDGYLLVKGMFDEEETRMMRDAARGDSGVASHAYDVRDASGRNSKLTLWNHPSDDIFGMTARSERIVNAAERLLDDEVYHYHSKLSIKEPHVGGAWEWHQDYGYWYQNGCLFPDMLSVMIALDPATRENGCMQVLRGSHKMGRIDHNLTGDQTGADLERVELAKQKFELVYCEMDSGDAFFFHCNTLHASAPNDSDKPRWVLICCYNTRHNDPVKQHHHPGYTPLQKVPNDAVRQAGATRLDPARAYLDPDRDKTTAAGKK
jgi:ectoine hydroxylase-related dioxygenase (phytanoyl-CoA dioxygenase family)